MIDFPPCFHPTTVVLVDDNVRFMESLSFGLHALQVNFKLFGSAKEALVWINANNSAVASLEDDDMDEGALPSFKKRLFSPLRFEEVTMVIVDYDMPEMSGLEFCKGIQNAQIKKIMLTGVAGENIAIQAFNEDIIDRFIVKQDAQALEKVIENVEMLQRDYFNAKATYLQQNQMVHSYFPFLEEAAFRLVFDDIFNQGDYVEYYVDTIPGGIWLVKANGDSNFLAVQSESLCADQLVVARDQGAPAELLQALSSDDIVTCFPDKGFYAPECEQWQSALHQASICEGDQQNYRYALVQGLSPDGDIFSFNAFLDQ